MMNMAQLVIFQFHGDTDLSWDYMFIHCNAYYFVGFGGMLSRWLWTSDNRIARETDMQSF